jgi:hypothetical protein
MLASASHIDPFFCTCYLLPHAIADPHEEGSWLVRWGLLAAGMRVHASLPSEARPPRPHRPLRSAYRRGTIGDSTRIRPLSGSRPPPSSACPEAAATGIRAHNDVAPPAFVHLDEAAPPTCVHLGKAVASGFRRDP